MNDQEYLASEGIQDPESGNKTSETPEPTPEAQQPPTEMFELNGTQYPVNTNFKIVHGGKVAQVPYSTLANTWRQQSHLQEKWNQFKPQLDEWQKMRPEFDRYKGFYDKYNPIQSWSEQNPDQWQRLWSMFQNKDALLQQGQQPGQPSAMFDPRLDPVLQKLEKWEAAQEEQKEAQDVEFVKKEINDFQQKYPEINLQERDPDGVSLWAKIVNWGMQNKYAEFTPAALVYLHERIADTHAQRARSEAMKAQVNDHKQGIVKRSATPFNGQDAKPMDIRKMSYGQIAEMAKNQMTSQQ